MAASKLSNVIQHIYRSTLPGWRDGMNGGALLDLYIAQRDESAFAGLVGLHGPMVLQVCRRVLGNLHDAEDAFQATFLVLARKAGSVRPSALVGNWLYGVAYRTALAARAVNNRRAMREKQVQEMPEAPFSPGDLWHGLQPLLDHEVNRLPDKYRAAVVLCELEGRSRKDVADHLGIPEGTLSSRLAAARKMLADRLTRRGVALSVGALSAVLAQQTAPAACVPSALAISTTKAATLFAAGLATTEALVSAKAIALAKGTMTAMFISKLKTGALVTLMLGFLATVGGLWAYPGIAAEPERPALRAQADGKKEGQPDKKDGVPKEGDKKRDGDKPAPNAKPGKGVEVNVTGTISKADVKKTRDDGTEFTVTVYTLTEVKGNKVPLPAPRINEAGKNLDNFNLANFVGKKVTITGRGSAAPAAEGAGAPLRVIRIFVINTVTEVK